MITKMLLLVFAVAAVLLVRKWLIRRRSNEVYIRRNYEKFKRLDEQVSGRATDADPGGDREPGNHMLR